MASKMAVKDVRFVPVPGWWVCRWWCRCGQMGRRRWHVLYVAVEWKRAQSQVTV